MADIVLRGGEIINGEGHPAVSGDVVVDGGTGKLRCHIGSVFPRTQRWRRRH